MNQLLAKGSLACLVLVLAGCLDTARPDAPPVARKEWGDTPPMEVRIFEDSLAMSVHVVRRAAIAPTPSSGNCVHVEGSPAVLNGLFKVEWDSAVTQEARLAIIYEAEGGAIVAAAKDGTSPLSISLGGLPPPRDESGRIHRWAFVITTIDEEDVLEIEARLHLNMLYMAEEAIPPFSTNSIHTCSGFPS